MTDKSEGADTIARAIEIDSSKKGRRSHGRAETLLGDFVKELRLPEDFGRGKISNLSAEDHARVEKETDPNLASDRRCT